MTNKEKNTSTTHYMNLDEQLDEERVKRKLKQTVPKQKAELIKAGYSVDEVSNEGKRIECYRELLN